jgi:hypothetical protein
MSHPNPLHDEENTMSQDSFDRFDEMAERTIWPWIDDESHDMIVEHDPSDILFVEYLYDGHEDEYDDSMDGDHESGLASAGWGTDEDYGFYGDYNEDY